MNWQTALILGFICAAAFGALILVMRISIGVWHGQPGWIVAGIALVAFIAWFFWDASI